MGLFRPPTEKIIIEQLIRYIYSKKTGKKADFVVDLGDNKIDNIVADFLDWLYENWRLDKDSSKRPKKVIEEYEKLYKKIQDYFYPPRYNPDNPYME